jgi:hypothetical protein
VYWPALLLSVAAGGLCLWLAIRRRRSP